MRDRVKRLFRNMPEDVEAVVVANAVDPHLDLLFFWATDCVHGGLFERSNAVLWRDGRVEVLTTPLEEGLAKASPDVEVTVYALPDERDAWLKRRLDGLSKVGVNASETVWQDVQHVQKLAPQAELVDVSKGVLKTRLVKDAKEIQRMQKACDVASAVANEVPSMLRPGMLEYELAAEIDYACSKRGAGGPSFSTIVGFGPNSAEPHYHPGAVPLTKGGYVLTDFGCYFEHYASDITRTFGYGGVDRTHREIYETVLRAQLAAIDAIRPGAKGVDVHKAAADVIDASPWKGRFIHGTGHGLGLVVHDGGAMNSRYDLTLEEGMVMTVEPGIYVPKVGGVRIEDDVVVTSNGCRLLTSAKKDWQDVR